MTKTYVKGKEYRINTDELGEKCDVVSFYTHSDDVSFDDGTTATDLKRDIKILSSEIVDLSSDLQDCFQSASNGKELVASAITGMGVETSSDATYKTMADNIRKIETVREGETLAYQLPRFLMLQ